MAVDLGTSRQITTVLRQSKISDVVHLLQQMRQQQVERNVFHYSAGIHACEKSKSWETALVLMEQMVDDRTTADTIVCNAAMSALEKGSQWHLALEMMRWMLRMRLEADTISYNALLSGLATSDHWKKALQVAEGMKQKSVAPSSITTNSLIDACRTTEEPLWHMAVQLLMALPQSSRTLVSYNSSISACGMSQSYYPDVRTPKQFQSSASSWPVAVSVLQSMSSVLVQPDIISYNTSMSVCEKSFEWQLPLHFLDLKGDMTDMMSFSVAICACEQVGDWEMAYELLRLLPMRRVGGNNFCRNSAIASLHPLAWPKGLTLAGEHLKKDVVTCNAALLTLPWVITLNILASMHQAQLEPTLTSLSTALAALAWPLALQLVAGFGRLDAIGYNGLLNAHKSSGWHSACQLLTLRCPTVISYSCAVSACEVASVPCVGGW